MPELTFTLTIDLTLLEILDAAPKTLTTTVWDAVSVGSGLRTNPLPARQALERAGYVQAISIPLGGGRYIKRWRVLPAGAAALLAARADFDPSDQQTCRLLADLDSARAKVRALTTKDIVVIQDALWAVGSAARALYDTATLDDRLERLRAKDDAKVLAAMRTQPPDVMWSAVRGTCGLSNTRADAARTRLVGRGTLIATEQVYQDTMGRRRERVVLRVAQSDV